MKRGENEVRKSEMDRFFFKPENKGEMNGMFSIV